MGKTLEFAVNLSMLMSGNLEQRLTPALASLGKLEQKTRELQRTSGQISSYQKQSTSLTQLEQKVTKARERYESLGRQLSETTKPNAKLRADYAQALQQYEKLNSSLTTQRQKVDELGKSLESAGVKTSDLSRHQGELQSSIEKNVQAQKRLTDAQNRYAQLRAKFDWGNIKGDVIKSAAIVSAFKQPITVAMNFDQAMAQVRAVKTMTQEEFTKLETQAMELGASTQFSATQAANTQENLARAGMSIKDITAAMPAVLSMAGAEGMDLAQAGSIIAKGLGGMSLAGDLAPRLADVLAYTSSSSNTDIVEIGEAFKVVAPVLSKQGATMEQIASYIGVMANKGYTGSEAGNALASTTMRLANLPKKARDKLLNIGLDSRRFKTKEGRMVELPEIMKMIDSAMKAKNLGEFEQLDILSEVFGKNQGKAMSAFLTASAQGQVDTMQTGVYNDSFGKAAEMNATRNNTLKGDITSLESAWEGFMIRIGKPLEPINRFFTQTLTTALQKATAFMNEHAGFFDLVIQSCYALGGIKIATTVFKYFSLGIEYFSSWRAVKVAEKAAELATAGANAGTLAANMSGAAKGASLFGMSLNTALGVIGLIAFASYEIYTHWEDITAAAQRAGEAISSIDTNKFTQAKAGTLSRSDADYGVAVMSSTYMPPEIPAHAFGGILTSPHVGLVAEAGPEAIIPLRDRSRGIQVLGQAAKILGLPDIFTKQEGKPTPVSTSREVNTLTSRSSTSATTSATASTSNTSLKELSNNVTQASNSISNDSTNALRTGSMNFSPTYNITVNGGEREQSIGENIRAVIEDTMSEMMSRMERVSYA